MDVNVEVDDVDAQLRSKSIEDVKSVSSSILDMDDDDDYEDGINVTLLSKPADLSGCYEKSDDCQDKELEKELNASSVDASTPVNSNDSKAPREIIKAKRLNGAGRKRFKYLLAHGHSHDEAREMATKPFKVPYTDPNKRRRNAELNESNSSDTNPPKRTARPTERGNTTKSKFSAQARLEKARGGEVGDSSTGKGEIRGSTKPSYSEVCSSIRIGILLDGYPNVAMTNQQQVVTQKAILMKVAGQRKETMKPKFGNCLLRPGHVIINCKNQATVDWLKASIASVKPWEGANLIAVDEKDIPKPELIVGFFPRSAEDSTDDILGFVESQNEGLLVDSWMIQKRYTVKQHHVELVFTVDAVSMETLEKCQFTVDYKFGVAYLRKKASTKMDSNEENHDASETKNDVKLVKGDTEQSTSSEIHDSSEDAEMREANQLRTEASGPEVGSNATAYVESCSFNSNACLPGTSGVKNSGNSQLPANLTLFKDVQHASQHK